MALPTPAAPSPVPSAYALQPQPAVLKAAEDRSTGPVYRFLTVDDVVQPDDEFIADDHKGWVKSPNWAVRRPYLTAYKAARRLVAQAPQDPDKWRLAVDDALVSHMLDCTTPESDPKECVQQLLQMSVTIALDPAVSREAQALVDRGAALPAGQRAAVPQVRDGFFWGPAYRLTRARLEDAITNAPEVTISATDLAMLLNATANYPEVPAAISDELIERLAEKHLTVHMETDIGASEPHAWVEGEAAFARALLAEAPQEQPAQARTARDTAAMLGALTELRSAAQAVTFVTVKPQIYHSDQTAVHAERLLAAIQQADAAISRAQPKTAPAPAALF